MTDTDTIDALRAENERLRMLVTTLEAELAQARGTLSPPAEAFDPFRIHFVVKPPEEPDHG